MLVTMNFCVIIPTFNEAPVLSRCVNAVRASHQFAVSISGQQQRVGRRLRFVVTDGGSTDGTQEAAAHLGCEVLGPAPGPGKGRGFQLAFATDHVMPRGGAQSLSEEIGCDDDGGICGGWEPIDDDSTVLLFLHADCIIAETALPALARSFSPAPGEPGCDVATLRLQFSLPPGASALRRCFFQCCEGWCFRGDGLWRSFGDQAIAITPRALRRAGGFPRWPLFEDVELFRRCRRAARSAPAWGAKRGREEDPVRLKRVVKVDAPVVASIRRFEQHGDLRYAAKCWLLVSLFALGASPEWLAGKYGRRWRVTPVT